MALTREELEDIRMRVEAASRPLVFYDDDADGLASYFLVLKKNADTIGIRGARGPELDVDFARKVEENMPDLILILDKPRVDPEFFKNVRTPTIWVDHHDPAVQEPSKWGWKNLTYYNPRLHNDRDSRSVSYWMWRALGGPIWIAAVGTTGDWHDSLLEPMQKEYPKLVPKSLTVKDALYKSPLGELVRIFNFSLKGQSTQIQKTLSALSKIENPIELLERTSPRARFVWKHYLPIVTEYEKQRAEAKQSKVTNGLYMHVFGPLTHSLVAEVANEMLVTKNAKIVLVGRRVGGEVKFSMRSHQKNLPPIVEKALAGVQGYGGGHKEACGGSVAEHDWDAFVKSVKKQL